jgi:RNA polymerase sigma-70 factor, ECF subfamily
MNMNVIYNRRVNRYGAISRCKILEQINISTKEVMELRFKEIWPRIYRFFYYKMQNREEAEELTQETFRRVLPQLEAGKVEWDKLMGYTAATARNLLVDTWRSRSRQPITTSLEGLQEKGWDHPQQVTEVEETLMVQQALRQLNEEHRKVLTYRIIEGWPVDEVANKMKRSPGAVRSLQFRAVKALKDTLEKGGYFHG